MTAVILDGFAHYGTGSVGNTNMLAGPYASLDNNEINIPVWDTTALPALSWTGVNQSEVRRVLPATGTHFFVSFRFAADTINTVPGPFGGMFTSPIEFRDGSNNMLFYLAYTSTGALGLYKAPRNGFTFNGVLVAQTSGPVIVAENFHFFEMEVNTSANTFTLRVDDSTGTGTPILSVTDSSISGTIAQVAFLVVPTVNTGGVGRVWLRDLFIRDANGSINNGWLGDRRIATLWPNADTANAGWTPRFYKEFGAGILWAANAGQCLYCPSATSLDLGSGDYTLEGFFRFSAPPVTGGYSTIFSRWDTSTNQRSYRFIVGDSAFNSGCLQLDISTDGTNANSHTMFQYPWIPDLDRWYHIALVRASSQLLLFVDGNQLGLPISDSHTYYASGTESLGIGGEIQGTSTLAANTQLFGWFDETRLTIGYARYTTSFAVPTSAFPRGSGSDPHWSDVALIAGYDTAISDESSFGRPLNAVGGAFQFTPADGPLVGSFSTINKQVPDDSTFMSAYYIGATGVLTMTVQPANNDTVTVGTKNGSTAAVYTFKTSLTGASFEVLIDTTAQNTLLNLYNAINLGPGIGTKYGTGTTANFDVTSTQLPAGQIMVTANVRGTSGNSIATSATGTSASWGGTHLTGGANIPGPSDFKLGRPPVDTTVISAVQLATRMWKSDAGTCTVQPDLVGPLGGVETGTAHPLTTSHVYYEDVFELDPDTSGPISPSTLINGAVRLNRTA